LGFAVNLWHPELHGVLPRDKGLEGIHLTKSSTSGLCSRRENKIAEQEGIHTAAWVPALSNGWFLWHSSRRTEALVCYSSGLYHKTPKRALCAGRIVEL